MQSFERGDDRLVQRRGARSSQKGRNWDSEARYAPESPPLLTFCVWLLPVLATLCLGAAFYLGLTSEGTYPSHFNIHRLQ